MAKLFPTTITWRREEPRLPTLLGRETVNRDNSNRAKVKEREKEAVPWEDSDFHSRVAFHHSKGAFRRNREAFRRNREASRRSRVDSHRSKEVFHRNRVASRRRVDTSRAVMVIELNFFPEV